MKRFIRYLYEYEQGKRMRNVGFVKVEQGEDECMVHIHGKGLRMGGDTTLMIYLLFEDDGKCFGVWQGEADNVNPAVNECVSYTVEDMGTPENYAKIGGVALENKDGRRYAALWDEKPIDLAHMQVWSSDETKDKGMMAEAGPEEQEDSSENVAGNNVEEVPENASVNVAENREMPEAEPGKLQTPENQEDIQEAERKEQEDQEKRELAEEQEERELAEEQGDTQEAETEETVSRPKEDSSADEFDDEIPSIRSEGFFFMEEPGRLRPKPAWRTRKIQRTELAKLARCEWRLANNNFLLHGYYNYHHLILLEKGDQLMLGVPGIYHEKEAAAAGAFGFPEFIEKDRLEVNLSPDEYNEEQPFGYWCRPVKRAFKWE